MHGIFGSGSKQKCIIATMGTQYPVLEELMVGGVGVTGVRGGGGGGGEGEGIWGIGRA